MSIEKGLYKLIVSNGGVTSLLNTTTPNSGVYWILAPKGANLDYIILTRVTTTDEYTLAGVTGFRNAIFQIDCYSSTYYKSRAIADAVRALLENYVGTLPDTNSTKVSAVLTEKDWDMPYEEGTAQVGFIFRTMLHFRVWYTD